ncbi:YihY/virulence factor BrkB family protein [Sphingomonas baiyangensis]|uniref:YihY/virulence factor BrkB family protein n=1 Tax=Sphingomonas baiyangensis TaxID=2572576 RepID=A0A4U1L0N0_9SPHN|nr:YihY/virulence factor BrkB family protein [Sphingomonas baiyangensis]TKD50301.1 YihY/virulence factor BrkB family protein [Sphingomonas baiyangensis]
MSDTEVRTAPENVPGGASRRPWEHPWRAWKAILARVWVMMGYHNLTLMAAGVAFYAFLSFVPLLGAIVMSYGVFADPAAVVRHMDTIFELLPPDAARLVSDQLIAVVTTAAETAGLSLVIALTLSVYGAMRASSAIIQALNVIYEEEEGRNIIQTTLLSAFLTLGAVLAALVGLVSAGALGYLRFLSDYLGSSGVLLIQIVTWLIATLIASTAFAFVYRYGPDRARARWQWLSIGSVAATLLWLGATLGFGIYVANFANYNATYGALGAVVVLLMWLFVSSYAVLIGAEINAEAERQTGVDTTTGRERPIGQRGAVMADSLPSKRQHKPRRDKY